MAETSISGIEYTIKGSTGKAKTSVDKLTSSLKSLRSALRSSSTSKLTKDLDDIDKSAKKTSTTFGKLTKSIGRITFYRSIRAALRYISEGFKEGLENAYQFSKITGYELAGTMDRLSSAGLKMKNQLGSAFGGLIMAAEPILLQLIALVTRAANALAQFMAIIGGKSTYLKAIDTVKKYGEAVGGAGQAAKEAMRYLAPFDELNRLPDDNSGSGGGGSSVPDYSAMFEETPVSQALQDFATSFKLSVSDVLFDWSDLTGEQIAEKALAGLFALTGAGVGFILGGVPGAIVGSLIGLALGLVADSFTFDHDGVLSKGEIADSLQYVLAALAGGVIGFVVGGPAGALIGASVGLGLTLLADAFDFKAGSENKNTFWKDNLVAAMTTIAGGVIGFMVGGPLGALIGATIGLGINLVLEGMKPNAGGERSGFQDELASAMETMTGGLIGFVVGGPFGAILGMTLTVGLHMLLKGSISEFINEKIVAPMVSGYNEFIEEHPKVAAFLGLEPYEFAGTTINENGFSGSDGKIPIDVEITSVTDNVPKEDRILRDWGISADDWKDEIPESDKVISLTGHFTKGEDDIPTDQKTVGITGKFTIGQDAIPEKQKTMMSIAKFTSKQTAFTGNWAVNGNPMFGAIAKFTHKQTAFTGAWSVNGNPMFGSVAKFTSKQQAFTGAWSQNGAPIFGSIAKFNQKQTAFTGTWSQNGNPIFGSIAKFTAKQQAFTGDWSVNGAPMFGSIAKFTTSQNGLSYTPSFNSVAYLDDWENGLNYKPRIEVDAYIDNMYDSNGYKYNAGGGIFSGGQWHDIAGYASGGSPKSSQLFYARENGAPELVGTIGNQTAVLNNGQIVESVAFGVQKAIAGIRFHLTGMSSVQPTQTESGMDEESIYRAMVRALNDADVFPDTIDLDGDVVYRKMVNRNRQERMRLGVNPMMTA